MTGLVEQPRHFGYRAVHNGLEGLPGAFELTRLLVVYTIEDSCSNNNDGGFICIIPLSRSKSGYVRF